MKKSELREGLVKTFTHWCRGNKASDSQKRASDGSPKWRKPKQETHRIRKISCPESAIASHAALVSVGTLQNNDVTSCRDAMPSSPNSVAAHNKNLSSQNAVKDFLVVPSSSEFNTETSFKSTNRSSWLRSSRNCGLGPHDVNQSGASKPSTACRVRKQGVTFKATEFIATTSSCQCSQAVSDDCLKPKVIATLAPPSGGCKRLPNGRCRRFSDVMEYRHHVRLRRASCGTEASPCVSSAAMSPLNCQTSLHCDVSSSNGDATYGRNNHNETPTSPSQWQNSRSAGRVLPSPKTNRRDRAESQDKREAPTHASSPGRVRQLLRQLDSAPVSVISPHSCFIALHRSRNCDMPNAAENGGDIGINGGSDARDGKSKSNGPRGRSQSLSSVDVSRLRKTDGGIICANRDIISMQGNVGGLRSSTGRSKVRDRSASTGEKRNVTWEKSVLRGSVAPWQGNDLVVNASAMGRAIEEHLNGVLSSQTE